MVEPPRMLAIAGPSDQQIVTRPLSKKFFIIF